MADSFAALKKSRNNSLERLTKEVQKFSAKYEKQTDDRFWQPDVDKGGNGYAVIRFLPATQGEDVPWVRIWNHGFKNDTNGKWYIENSLTTIGLADPVSDLNTKLWNSTQDDEGPGRKQARRQKRKLTYISNIMVIKDASHPEKEGKIFLYRYGKKIFDKINSLMNPEFEDETPVNPFDFWAGANLKLKIRMVEGYRNYDKSEFDTAAPLSEDDADIEKTWKNQYSLQAFANPNQFKTYDELKARLSEVLELASTEASENLAEVRPAAPRVGKSVEAVSPKKAAEVESVDTYSKDMELFKSLVEDDE